MILAIGLWTFLRTLLTGSAARRRVLFTMLTTLGFRYPPGREPPVIAGIRQYLGG